MLLTCNEMHEAITFDSSECPMCRMAETRSTMNMKYANLLRGTYQLQVAIDEMICNCPPPKGKYQEISQSCLVHGPNRHQEIEDIIKTRFEPKPATRGKALQPYASGKKRKSGEPRLRCCCEHKSGSLSPITKINPVCKKHGEGGTEVTHVDSAE